MFLTRNQWIAIAVGAALIFLVSALVHVVSLQRTLNSIHSQIESGEGLGEGMPLTQRELQALFSQKTQAKMLQDLAQGTTDSKFLALGPAMAEILADGEAWEMSRASNFKRQLLDAEGKSVFRDAQGNYRGLNRYVVIPHNYEVPALVLKRKGLGWEIETLEFLVD